MAIDVKEMVDMIEEGCVLVENGEYEKVLDYDELMKVFMNELISNNLGSFVNEFLSELNVSMIFSPIVAEYDNCYFVGKGVSFELPYINFSLKSTIDVEDGGYDGILCTFDIYGYDGKFCKHHCKVEEFVSQLALAIKFIKSYLM